LKLTAIFQDSPVSESNSKPSRVLQWVSGALKVSGSQSGIFSFGDTLIRTSSGIASELHGRTEILLAHRGATAVLTDKLWVRHKFLIVF
jgi:hypothetical protein